MSAEICLSWNGMSSDDKTRQINKFDNTTGRYGYLGCPLGKHWDKEYEILKILFGDDFHVYFSGRSYLFELAKSKWEAEIKKYITDLKIESIDVHDNPLPYQLIWIRSLIEFYQLGCGLEKDGFNPIVKITW